MGWRLLLSHHPPHEAHRCIHLGGKPWLCRRCTFLWPLSLVVLVAQLSLGLIPEAFHRPLLLILPLPAVFFFIREQIGWAPYHPFTVIWTSLVLAPAIGVGLARYLQTARDPLFWGMVLLFAGPCFVAVVWRKFQLEGNIEG